jgi:hypothetical protein
MLKIFSIEEAVHEFKLTSKAPCIKHFPFEGTTNKYGFTVTLELLLNIRTT